MSFSKISGPIVGGGAAQSTAVAVFSPSTTAGSILFAICQWAAGATFVSIADTGGNTWTQAATEINDGTNRFRLYYATAVGGASTVTLTVSTNVKIAVAIAEFGVSVGSALMEGTPVVATQSGTSYASGSLTTTVNDCLVVNAYGQNGARTITDLAGYTVATSGLQSFIYLLTNTAGSQSDNGTLNSGTISYSILVAFKPVAAPLSGVQRAVVTVME